MKLGVLISGRGSNLQALLEARRRGQLQKAEFAVVLSNDPSARGLHVAAEHGVPTGVVDHRAFRGDRAGHDAAVRRELEAHGVEAVVLAGYMRVVGAPLLERWPNLIVNIHPALLPAFPGLHAQRQALDYGVRVTGCTVHFVDAGTDTGPIILQKVVSIESADTEESLAARILVEEHRAIVEAVTLLTEGRISLVGRKVVIR